MKIYNFIKDSISMAQNERSASERIRHLSERQQQPTVEPTVEASEAPSAQSEQPEEAILTELSEQDGQSEKTAKKNRKKKEQEEL
jgi:hypothetical protein